MRSLLVAIGFLTRLPVPRVDGDFAAAVRLYPLVGLLIGALVAAAGWLAAQVDPWLGALAALAAWTWITGALHLDGLADLADGLGAAHGNRDRLLAVMADPHIGSFGTVAIVLQLAAKLIAIHLLLPGHAVALVAIPAAARLGPLAWARYLRPLKLHGLGAAIAGAIRPRDLIGWGALLLAACIALPLLALTLPAIALLAWGFRHKTGGVTGDMHGAGIELTETALLLAFATLYAVR